MSLNCQLLLLTSCLMWHLFVWDQDSFASKTHPWTIQPCNSFFVLHQGGFSPAPVGEGTLQLATVTALHGWSYSAWIHWYSWINQSPLMKLYIMYFKAIFSSLGIPSWNKLLNGRMVASLLRSLPQSWLLNLPRRNCWLRKTPKRRYQICLVTHNSMGFPPSSWISHWRWWSWKGFL